MVIIGGLGSVLGSVLGAVFLTLLPEVLRLSTSALSDSFPRLVQLFSPLKLGVFGLTIVLFLIFEPDGLADLCASCPQLVPAVSVLILREDNMKLVHAALFTVCLAVSRRRRRSRSGASSI